MVKQEIPPPVIVQNIQPGFTVLRLYYSNQRLHFSWPQNPIPVESPTVNPNNPNPITMTQFTFAGSRKLDQKPTSTTDLQYESPAKRTEPTEPSFSVSRINSFNNLDTNRQTYSNSLTDSTIIYQRIS